MPLLLEIVNERKLEALKPVATRAATTIEQLHKPEHPEIEQEKLALEYKAATVRALRAVAKGEIKPDVIQEERAPGILLTSVYSANKQMRLQIRENKNNGIVEVHLLKVNHNPQEDAKSPTAIAADIPCTAYTLANNVLELQSAQVDTLVRFSEDLGTKDEFKEVTESAPVAADPSPGKNRLRKLTDQLNDPVLQREKQVKVHTQALETVGSVLLKENFNLTRAEGIGLSKWVINDITADVGALLKHGLAEETFAVSVGQSGDEILETTISDLRNGYKLTFRHFVSRKHIQISVLKGTQDNIDNPAAEIDIDLEKQIANVTVPNVMLGRLKERGTTGHLLEELPSFSFNPVAMERRYASAAMIVDKQGGDNREYVVKAIAAIIGTEQAPGYALEGKPRKTVRLDNSGRYILETKINAPDGRYVVIEEVLLGTDPIAIHDNFKIKLVKNEGDELVREWNVESTLHDEAIPVAINSLKMTGALRL